MKRVLEVATIVFLSWTVTSANAQEVLPILDFCELAPTKNTTTYQKQRVILFSMAGIEQVEAGEEVINEKGEEAGTRDVLAAVGAGAHFFEVWTMTFPLKRFYNIITPTPTPTGLASQSSFLFTEIQDALGGQPYGEFVAYSVACADYIAMPTLTSFDAKWSMTEKTKIVDGEEVTYTVEALSVRPSVELTIFKRQDDEFVLVERVSESGGGLFDAVTDLGAGTLASAKKGNEKAGNFLQSNVDRYKSKLRRYQRKLDNAQEDIESYQRQVDRYRSLVAVATSADLPKLEVQLHRFEKLKSEAEQIIKDIEEKMDLLVDLVEDPTGVADSLARSQNSGWSGLVSGMPADAECETEPPREAHRGILQCTDAPFWLPARALGVAGLSERAGEYCDDVDENDRRASAVCEVRVRAENITLLVQKSARSIPGWKLYAPLQMELEDHSFGEDAEEPKPAISLGDNEGVRRGDIFVAVVEVDGKSQSLGFARVIRTGPGGKLGEMVPTTMVWRAGGADEGVRMEEHPQIGVSITPRLGTSVGISTNPGNFLVKDLSTTSNFALDVGYSLTPYVDISWGELWLRTHLGLLSVTGEIDSEISDLFGDYTFENLSIFMINTYAGPELKLYLASRLDLFFGLAGGVSYLVMGDLDSTIENEDGEEEADLGSALQYGLLADAGLDLLLHPDWSLRATVGYRYIFGDFVVDSETEGSIWAIGEDNDFTASWNNVGDLSGVNATVGVTYIF
jgi:hypothetical protein